MLVMMLSPTCPKVDQAAAGGATVHAGNTRTNVTNEQTRTVIRATRSPQALFGLPCPVLDCWRGDVWPEFDLKRLSGSHEEASLSSAV